MRCLHCHTDGLSSSAEVCPECGVDQASLRRGLLPEGHKLHDGAYVLNHAIGRGEFGVTYRAFDVAASKVVVVKELLPRYAIRDERDRRVIADSGAEQAFEKDKRVFVEEHERLGMVKHPAVVDVQAVFEENGTAYVCMELLVGETLEAELKRKKKLAEEDVWTMAEHLCSALSAVHPRAVLHLDLRPASIFHKSDGQVVLIDFGSVRQSSERASVQSGMSDPYVPFEQHMHATTGRELTPATDVYALAVTLVEALTGQVPPSVQERLAGARLLVEDVLTGKARVPDVELHTEYPDLYRSWRKALQPALRFHVEQRTRSAQALWDAIQDERSRSTRPPPVSPQGDTPASKPSDAGTDFGFLIADEEDDASPASRAAPGGQFTFSFSNHSTNGAEKPSPDRDDSDMLDLRAMASAVAPDTTDDRGDDVLRLGSGIGFGASLDGPLLRPSVPQGPGALRYVVVVIGLLLVAGVFTVVWLLIDQRHRTTADEVTQVAAPSDILAPSTGSPPPPSSGDATTGGPSEVSTGDSASPAPEVHDAAPAPTQPEKSGRNGPERPGVPGGSKAASPREDTPDEPEPLATPAPPGSKSSDEAPREPSKTAPNALDSLLNQVTGGKNRPAPAPENPGDESSGGGEGGGDDLPAQLSKNQVIAGMSRVAGRVARCGAGQAGTVTMDVVINGATGRVASVNVGGQFAGTPVGSCAARAVRAATFPRFTESPLTIRGYSFQVQ